MTEIQESYGTAARATYAGAGDDGPVDFAIRCTECGTYFASASVAGSGRVVLRGKCRRCRHGFTFTRDVRR